MNPLALHTSDSRRANRVWLLLGGRIIPIRRTGENRYVHDYFARSLRMDARRNDVPAKLLSRINQLLRTRAANDDIWNAL